MCANRSNWAGNYTYQAARWHMPKTVEQVQHLVVRSRRLKALGTRHSFHDIADTSGDLLSLEHFNQVLALDPERHTVTVGAGIAYGDLARYLHRAGYALHNLASLPHISVAGACATATHGSGERLGNLATVVRALELVTAAGDVVVLDRTRHTDQFAGSVVALGGLGIVTQLTLDIEPAFDMCQVVYENLPFAQAAEHFDELAAHVYSVSLFTDWRNASFNQVWVKHRYGDNAPPEIAPSLWGAPLAATPHHPISGQPVINCTVQLGIPGPWHERLPHFRLEFTPSNGDELQSEYLVPRQHALAALEALEHIHDQLAPLVQVSEIRTIAADSLWLSPCYQQDCMAIHFTWHPQWAAVRQVLPLIEAQLAPFGARPHWGKLFTMSPAHIHTLYPKLCDFQDLLHTYDPQGKFRNAFLNTYIYDGR